ncbi:hypothetical protein [uncultured Planococcus sp.]|uniref:hypothetical protein n=1 Tax=Planococcus donghaensis TaxID=414778 RepID=UPI002620017D|nr:hypothetical protein [uncultured Planococcus sp.]
MTKNSFQGPVPEITMRSFLIPLLSFKENGLLQGKKNCRKTGNPEKEAGHMYIYLWIQNLLSNPFLTTHTPHGGKHPKTCTAPIEYSLANRTEECA